MYIGNTCVCDFTIVSYVVDNILYTVLRVLKYY